MIDIGALVIGAWIAIAALAAQSPTTMAFEVASVRQSEPGAGPHANFPLDAGDAYAATGGRFSACFPLATYIKFAYKLSLTQDQIQTMIAHLPKWVAADRFDIE